LRLGLTGLRYYYLKDSVESFWNFGLSSTVSVTSGATSIYLGMQHAKEVKKFRILLIEANQLLLKVKDCFTKVKEKKKNN